MTLNSKHRTKKLKTKAIETRKNKTQKDENVVLPKVLKSSIRFNKKNKDLLTIMLHVLSSKATLQLTYTLK